MSSRIKANLRNISQTIHNKRVVNVKLRDIGIISTLKNLREVCFNFKDLEGVSLFKLRYSCTTAKVGVNHKLISQSIKDLMGLIEG